MSRKRPHATAMADILATRSGEQGPSTLADELSRVTAPKDAPKPRRKITVRIDAALVKRFKSRLVTEDRRIDDTIAKLIEEFLDDTR